MKSQFSNLFLEINLILSVGIPRCMNTIIDLMPVNHPVVWRHEGINPAFYYLASSSADMIRKTTLHPAVSTV